jgi:hypothetical protein
LSGCKYINRMNRLFIPLFIAGLLFFHVAADKEMNRTDAYIVREYALISYSEEMTPIDQVNVTLEEKNAGVAGNQTPRGDEMTARKLFKLKQAAREGFVKVGIPRDDLVSNQSAIYTGGNSESCIGCMKETAYGTFSY